MFNLFNKYRNTNKKKFTKNSNKYKSKNKYNTLKLLLIMNHCFFLIIINVDNHPQNRNDEYFHVHYTVIIIQISPERLYDVNHWPKENLNKYKLIINLNHIIIRN